MAFVFVLDAFRPSGLHRNRFGDAFQSLEARHFVNAHRVRIGLKIQLRSFSPRLTDNFHLCLKNGVVLFGCVQPVLAAMRLKFGRSEVTADLAGRDRRNNFSFDGFISQFGVSPFGNGTTRKFRWLTGDRHDERDLFGGELSERSASRSIIQNIFDRPSKCSVCFPTFDGNESIKGSCPLRIGVSVIA